MHMRILPSCVSVRSKRHILSFIHRRRSGTPLRRHCNARTKRAPGVHATTHPPLAALPCPGAGAGAGGGAAAGITIGATAAVLPAPDDAPSPAAAAGSDAAPVGGGGVALVTCDGGGGGGGGGAGDAAAGVAAGVIVADSGVAPMGGPSPQRHSNVAASSGSRATPAANSSNDMIPSPLESSLSQSADQAPATHGSCNTQAQAHTMG
jgi:hypothetical protein